MSSNPSNLKLYVTYQQVSIFDPTLSNPFNFWEDRHISQGFSWREKSIAFGTLKPDGEIEVEIATTKEPQLAKDVTRAIVVPFEMPECEKLELATITESHLLTPPRNTKGILFEAGIGGNHQLYKITFITGELPKPKILVADSELSIPDEYLMDTIPG